MPKKLEIVQKAFDEIAKKIDDSLDEMTKINTNYWQHVDLVYDGQKVIVERIVELKKGGAQGDTIEDFDDNELKEYVKGVDGFKKDAVTETKKYYIEENNLKKLIKKLEELNDDVSDIVKAKKKQWGKSKSLPQLQKVNTAIATMVVDSQAGIGVGPHAPGSKTYKMLDS